MCENWLKSVKLVDRWYFLFPWKMCALVPYCLVWYISWGLCYFSGRSTASCKAGCPGRSKRHPHEGTGTTAKRGNEKCDLSLCVHACVWCLGWGIKSQVESHPLESISRAQESKRCCEVVRGMSPGWTHFFLFRVLSPPLECRSRSCSPRSATAFSF